MRTVGIYGASDDLVELELDGQPFEELSALSKGRSFVFTSDGKALHADIDFDGYRGWRIALTLDDVTESGELPFRVHVRQREHSPLLLVELTGKPVVLTWVDDDGRPRTKALQP